MTTMAYNSFPQSDALIESSSFEKRNSNYHWVICPKCRMTIPLFTLFISLESPQINMQCSCSDKIQILLLKDYIEFLINNPIAISSQVCNRHSDREAPKYCYICKEYLCKLCSKYHKEKYNTHFISSKPIPSQKRCTQHPDKLLDIYCETCLMSICESCLIQSSNKNSDSNLAQGDIINHHNHQTKQLSVLWNEIDSKNLKQKYTEARNSMSDCKEIKTRLINQLTELIDKYTKLKDEIEKTYQKYYDNNIILNRFIDVVLWNFYNTELLPNANLMKSLNHNIVINDLKLELNNIHIKDKSDMNTHFNGNVNYNKMIQDNAIKMISYFKSNHILNNSIQCLSTFALHSMGVNSLIELRDGKMVSSSYEAIIWDRSQSKINQSIIKTIDTQYINIESLIQLHNGRIALGASDKLIKVYDQFNGLFLGLFQGHEAWINVLYQVKDSRLVSGSYQVIKIWDITLYKCVVTLNENIGGSVLSLSQLQSNDNLLSGSEDGFIRQWDIKEYKLLKTIRVHDGWVNTIIQLKHEMIATGGNDKVINLWNNVNIKYITSLRDNEHHILCLCQLIDKRLLSGSFKIIKVWSLYSFQCIFSITAHEDYITAIVSLNDRSVGTSSKDKLIKIWSI